MNRFGLPIHLFVEEGAYHRIPEVAEDILADIANHRSLVLTQDQAADKFSDVIDTVTQAFPLAEVQHAESAIYKDAVALAEYITGGDIRMIFAFGDTDLLNLAKVFRASDGRDGRKACICGTLTNLHTFRILRVNRLMCHTTNPLSCVCKYNEFIRSLYHFPRIFMKV